VAKSYRLVQRDQPFLMPPDMREWLPSDHLVWFLLETVEALDTSAFHARRRVGGVGAAGYDPDLLLGLLIYGYCQGVRSSRQIERRCISDVAFRVLCAGDVPDHATIARFRVDHQDVFEVLFTQVLQVAGAVGLARCGTVAIDGTKIAANASIDANRVRNGSRNAFRKSWTRRKPSMPPKTRQPSKAQATPSGCPPGWLIAAIVRSGSVRPPERSPN
jgi:transposase